MEIGLDFDGVITDCGQLKSDGAKKLYNVYISPGRFKKELVLGNNILTAQEYHRLQEIVYGTREVGLLMEPVAGVLQYLPRIIRNGHSVRIITSRGDAGVEIAREWSLKRNLVLNFIGVGHKDNKVEAATGLDIYMDDDFDKLKSLIGIVPRLFLFSWEYNKHIKNIDPVIRVESWKEFFDSI